MDLVEKIKELGNDKTTFSDIAFTAISVYLESKGWVCDWYSLEPSFSYKDPKTGQLFRSDIAFMIETDREMYRRMPELLQ